MYFASFVCLQNTNISCNFNVYTFLTASIQPLLIKRYIRLYQQRRQSDMQTKGLAMRSDIAFSPIKLGFKIQNANAVNK